MEFSREAACKVCKKSTTFFGDRIYNYAFKRLKKCKLTPFCNGNMYFLHNNEATDQNTIDFQEFKVQEIAKSTASKNCRLVVHAERDLVRSCSIGDAVRILGILELRLNEVSEVATKNIVIRAINIRKESLDLKLSLEQDEMSRLISAWNEDKRRFNNSEIEARNEMLKAVAPELKGTYGLKLALMMTLCSGGGKVERANHLTQFEPKDREIVHLLLAGIPGVGELIDAYGSYILLKLLAHFRKVTTDQCCDENQCESNQNDWIR
jgi:DNA replicative helicase MCM subunit Mcm2 (Cdc46/Mcm family)